MFLKDLNGVKLMTLCKFRRTYAFMHLRIQIDYFETVYCAILVYVQIKQMFHCEIIYLIMLMF